MFCILCLCIILCNTSKASENQTFVLKVFLSSVFILSSLSVVCMKIKDSVEQIALDVSQNLMYCKCNFRSRGR